MKTAGIKQLRDKLSDYLKEVRRGETVLVTDRGEVVAELRPPGGGAAPSLSEEERIHSELVRSGLIAREATTDEWPELPPKAFLPSGFDEALREEREE